MVVAVADVLSDLADESGWLDATVRDLHDEDWHRQTPAPGWTIAHQIAHLAWTDDQARCSATDPEEFAVRLNELLTGEVTIDSAAAEGAADPPEILLQRWRDGREQLAATLLALPPKSRLPWFGTEMNPLSTATGRIMETWAHGQDIAETLGVPHPPTNRLRHVAHIAVRARDYAFVAHGLTPPSDPFFVQVTAPDETIWTWGPDDAKQRVTGTALDLCLLATQRRHRLDTDLVAAGPDADRWLDIAQAFAGPPGAGREPQG
jgi:uncharacterized protein (TIGR03084 family)